MASLPFVTVVYNELFFLLMKYVSRHVLKKVCDDHTNSLAFLRDI
jgi:hypothetical protein